MPLSSHPVSQDEIEIDEDEACKIIVSQSQGFLCHISATARISISPKLLYEQSIVHPDNSSIFRHMNRCSFRKVGPRDPNTGVRTVHVAHEASWRFLLFHGTFTTHLRVIEDPINYSMKFKMFPHNDSTSNIVTKFQGEWKIEKNPQDPTGNSSISYLEQDVGLSVWIPPPLDKLLKSISANQVRRIVEDLQEEAKKIQQGKMSLVPYDEVKDKAIGEDVEIEDEGAFKE